MPGQKIILTGVEVNKYKSVEAKQEFEVGDKVTTLVGKNEAGKTAILEAVAKTNYFEEDPKFKFNATYDYPRKEKKRFDKSGEDVEVVTTTYRISDELLKEIQNKIGVKTFEIREFKNTKKYLSETTTYTGISADLNEFFSHKFKQHEITDQSFQEKVRESTNLSEIEALDAESEEPSHKKFLGCMRIYLANSRKWSNPISEYVAREYLQRFSETMRQIASVGEPADGIL